MLSGGACVVGGSEGGVSAAVEQKSFDLLTTEVMGGTAATLGRKPMLGLYLQPSGAIRSSQGTIWTSSATTRRLARSKLRPG